MCIYVHVYTKLKQKFYKTVFVAESLITYR
jgi:hypothetical protein